MSKTELIIQLAKLAMGIYFAIMIWKLYAAISSLGGAL
jgi:hypothetical protein